MLIPPGGSSFSIKHHLVPLDFFIVLWHNMNTFIGTLTIHKEVLHEILGPQ